jgi:heme-degrading monooxygenase HmoA
MAHKVLAVIACIIEFGVKEGRDDDRKRLLAELFVELDKLPGFLSKETFDDVDRPGRRITISYWTDADALRGWMLNAAHIRAIGLGKREVFSHYNIKSRPLSAKRTGPHRQKLQPASPRSHYLCIWQEENRHFRPMRKPLGEPSCR